MQKSRLFTDDIGSRSEKYFSQEISCSVPIRPGRTVSTAVFKDPEGPTALRLHPFGQKDPGAKKKPPDLKAPDAQIIHAGERGRP